MLLTRLYLTLATIMTGAWMASPLVSAVELRSADAMEQEEASPSAKLNESLRNELASRYPGARIELTGPIHWTWGALPAVLQSVAVRGETPRGELMFEARDVNGRRESVGIVPFEAWMPARVALKRILPGQRLSDADFKVTEVNVAAGPVREYRGVILRPETALDRLEARQTVLEGQFLASTAVQRTPDLRRGESVRVQLKSGDLSLSTLGIAEEPAYLDGQVRVSAGKAKRELVGKLVAGGIVEVQL